MKPNAVCMHASYVVPRVSTQLIPKFRHQLTETGDLTWYFPIFTMACIFVSSHTVLRASLVAQMVKNLPGMRETWVQSLGQKDPLEKGMATHSSILAWRIPWTEDRTLGSMELQRVRHSWATTLSLSYCPLEYVSSVSSNNRHYHPTHGGVHFHS